MVQFFSQRCIPRVKCLAVALRNPNFRVQVSLISCPGPGEGMGTGCGRGRGEGEGVGVGFESSSTFGLAASLIHKPYRWTPHPVIVTIRDNRDSIRGIVYFYYRNYSRAGGPANINPKCVK